MTLEGAGFGGDLSGVSDIADNTATSYQSLGYTATVWVIQSKMHWSFESELTFHGSQVGDTTSGEVFWISDSSIAAPAPTVAPVHCLFNFSLKVQRYI